MSTPYWRPTITLRDAARVTLRPIAREDKPLLAASFERLSEESRCRQFSRRNPSCPGLNSTTSLTSTIRTTRRLSRSIPPAERAGRRPLHPLKRRCRGRRGRGHGWRRLAGRGLGRALLGRLTITRGVRAYAGSPRSCRATTRRRLGCSRALARPGAGLTPARSNLSSCSPPNVESARGLSGRCEPRPLEPWSQRRQSLTV